MLWNHPKQTFTKQPVQVAMLSSHVKASANTIPYLTRLSDTRFLVTVANLISNNDDESSNNDNRLLRGLPYGARTDWGFRKE